ncbi:hypothetical protein BGW36DRAFT_360691 [Talaromyces proteolyticus]|uniref:Uncharacterized protein n=1 Tax=Talaromyces proteolyticus TaxID=1131652 RepID=A0AAD4KME1_9EURO|nr:uncharacterized protein BGW36DRAFT_360691 [Talaromyces proteolyticus]KAH8694972.1 hypothetical protein BGW36DRAFT_360691 [Talaromyces proteolyticus]
MAATMSATLQFPFQASLQRNSLVESQGELYGFDVNAYHEIPSPDLDEEEQLKATYNNPRWDSLPSDQELFMMASQRLSMIEPEGEMIREQQIGLSEEFTLYNAHDEEKEVVRCESPETLTPETHLRLLTPTAIPRYYSTPIVDNDPSTTPVLLYGLEQPSDYLLAASRKLVKLRPMSFLASGPASRPSSSHRHQPSPLSRTYKPEAPREITAALPPAAMKRLSTLLETTSQQIYSTYSANVPRGTATGASVTSSSTSSSTTSTVRSRATQGTIDSNFMPTPPSTVSPSPVYGFPQASASADQLKSTLIMARANTSLVDLASEQNSRMQPPPLPKPLRLRKTAPNMMDSVSNNIESSSTSATTPRSKPRDHSRRSSIISIAFPKLSSLGHRPGGDHDKQTIRAVQPNTPSFNLQPVIPGPPNQPPSRPLPLTPPLDNQVYSNNILAPIPHNFIQPDDIPSHTNCDEGVLLPETSAAAIPSQARGIRRVSVENNSTQFWKSFQSSYHQQLQQPQHRPRQASIEKKSHRLSKVFSHFVYQ